MSTHANANPKPSSLTIGQLARQAGVGIETIRYYQKRQLLPNGQTEHGQFRRYSLELVERINFIKRSQKLGFSLDEIAALLELNDAVERPAIRHLAHERLLNIQQKIKDLQAMEQALQGLIHACEDEAKHPSCPIIANLSGHACK